MRCVASGCATEKCVEDVCMPQRKSSGASSIDRVILVVFGCVFQLNLEEAFRGIVGTGICWLMELRRFSVRCLDVEHNTSKLCFKMGHSID